MARVSLLLDFMMQEVLSHLLEDGQTGAVVAEQVPRPAPGVSSLF